MCFHQCQPGVIFFLFTSRTQCQIHNMQLLFHTLTHYLLFAHLDHGFLLLCYFCYNHVSVKSNSMVSIEKFNLIILSWLLMEHFEKCKTEQHRLKATMLVLCQVTFSTSLDRIVLCIHLSIPEINEKLDKWYLSPSFSFKWRFTS